MLLERLRAYGPAIDATITIMDEGRASGRTAARIVAERTIEQLERLLAIPVDDVADPRPAQVATDADRERVAAVRARRRLPGQPAVPRRPCRATYLAATPGAAGPGLRPGRRGPLPVRDPVLDHARPGARPTSTRSGLDELAIDRRRAARDRPRGGLRRRRGRLPPRRSYADAANQAATREELVARADRGHRPRAGRRAARLRPPARARAAWSSRSRRSRSRTSPSPTTTRRRLDGSRPGHLLRQHLRPARAGPTPSSPRPRTTRRSPGTTSRSRWRWSTPASTSSGAWARAWWAAPTWRAGASTRSASPTSWACTAMPGERLGHARRAGLAGLAAGRRLRDARAGLDAASSRSTSCSQTGLSPTDAVIETDRYIAWPGQALCYMTGMREIRAAAPRARGPRRRGVRPPALPRRADRPRLAAAGDAGGGAPALGDAAGLTRGPRTGRRAQLSKPIPSASIARRNRPGRPSLRVGGDDRPAHQLHGRRPDGLRRDGERARPHEPQPQPRRVRAPGSVSRRMPAAQRDAPTPRPV